MRFLYSVLFYAFIPFLLLRLYWRGFKAPAYRLRWQERLGFYTQSSRQKVLWFHAVSVGEAEAVFPLVKQFMRHHPQHPILITTTTPTGSARVQAVMGQQVEHVYLPYDIPSAVQRFLIHFQPQQAVIMETEIWVNLFQLTAKAKIPLSIINARLSEKSYRGYQKISWLIHPTLAGVSLIGTQTLMDCQRFQTISPKGLNIQTLGNIKFDLHLPTCIIRQGQQLKTQEFNHRFVWIIASTHQGEEEVFFKLYPPLKKEIPDLLLLVVPRHPERFSDVEKLAQHHHLTLVKRTSHLPCHHAVDIYLADTMGELKMLYAAADIAFVGGSWFKHLGGHNTLEAVAVNVPVMFGTHMSHFKAIEETMLAEKAAIQCQNSAELISTVLTLYHNPDQRLQLTRQAKLFLQKNQGNIEKTFQQLIKQSSFFVYTD